MSRLSIRTLGTFELDGLTRRLGEVVESFGTRKAAAHAGEVTPEQIRRIVKGESFPSILLLGKLAKKKDYNLHWVITGEGKRRLLQEDGEQSQTASLKLENARLRELVSTYQKLLESSHGSPEGRG